jgi:rare lipoprotein A
MALIRSTRAAALAISCGLLAQAAQAQSQEGAASWYGPGFHGRTTASGEPFNQNALTAAHPSLPFGTEVRVTYEGTGESVVVPHQRPGALRPWPRDRPEPRGGGGDRAAGAGVGEVRWKWWVGCGD